MILSKIKLIIHWRGFNSCALRTNILADNLYNKDEILIITNDEYKKYDLVQNESLFKHINYSQFEKLNILNLKSIEKLIITGWSDKSLLKKFIDIKNLHSSMLIMSVDNIKRKKSIRQHLGKIYYYLYLKKNIDLFIVPGIKSLEFLTFIGVKSNKIKYGYYGHYSKIFKNSGNKKSKSILYVGEISKRKGSDLLIKEFKKFHKNHNDWELIIIGDQKDFTLPDEDFITKHDFLNPYKVNEIMNISRVFILPSRLDHWGTVVSEAAACGNILITSKNTGAGYDLVKQGHNGFIFNKYSELSLIFEEISNWSDKKLDYASNLSIKNSKYFSENSFFNAIQ